MPKRNAYTRVVDASGDLPYQIRSALPSPGFRSHPEVGKPRLLVYRDGFLLMECAIVQFLDESPEIRSHYVQNGDSPFSGSSVLYQSPGPSSASGQDNSNLTPNSTLFTPTEGLTVLSLLNSESPVQRNTSAPSMTPGQPPNTSAYQRHDDANASTFVYQQPPGEPVLWPLEQEQEAMLLQHYIENVALFVSLWPLTATRSFLLTIVSLI